MFPSEAHHFQTTYFLLEMSLCSTFFCFWFLQHIGTYLEYLFCHKSRPGARFNIKKCASIKRIDKMIFDGQLFFSHGKSNPCGVAIGFNGMKTLDLINKLPISWDELLEAKLDDTAFILTMQTLELNKCKLYHI